MRLYLDTAPVIYLVENVAPYAAPLIARLAQPDTLQICSELTRLECRVKPLRDGNRLLLQAFDAYFAEIAASVLSLSRPVMEQATRLRATYKFSTADAIHLAVAITAGCDRFVTNDLRLATFPEITVEVIEPAGA